jgi:hypothetical protein
MKAIFLAVQIFDCIFKCVYIIATAMDPNRSIFLEENDYLASTILIKGVTPTPPLINT